MIIPFAANNACGASDITALDEVAAARLAETFKVLGDPTRVRIISALCSKEMCVGALSASLGMSQSAVSHQLRVLRNLRLVRSRKEGRQVFYALDDEHVFALFEQGLEHIHHTS